MQKAMVFLDTKDLAVLVRLLIKKSKADYKEGFVFKSEHCIDLADRLSDAIEFNGYMTEEKPSLQG